MSVLLEKLKSLRNRAGCGHPQGWELMRDTMNTAIKLVESHQQADNRLQAEIALLLPIMERAEKYDNLEDYQQVYNKLRQLSAV